MYPCFVSADPTLGATHPTFPMQPPSSSAALAGGFQGSLLLLCIIQQNREESGVNIIKDPIGTLVLLAVAGYLAHLLQQWLHEYQFSLEGPIDTPIAANQQLNHRVGLWSPTRLSIAPRAAQTVALGGRQDQAAVGF